MNQRSASILLALPFLFGPGCLTEEAETPELGSTSSAVTAGLDLDAACREQHPGGEGLGSRAVLLNPSRPYDPGAGHNWRCQATGGLFAIDFARACRVLQPGTVPDFDPNNAYSWRCVSNVCDRDNDGCSGPLPEDYKGFFYPACVDHDRCYSTPGADKQTCDLALRDSARDICAHVPVIRRLDCRVAADLAYDAVDLFALPGFLEGQFAVRSCDVITDHDEVFWRRNYDNTVPAGGIRVRLSDGVSFQGPTVWSEVFYGSLGTHFADLDGDGKADMIAINDDTVTIRRSTGSGFLPNEDWTHGPFYGSRGTYLADVTGDRRADIIAVNDDTVTIRRSTGSGFGPNEDWTHGPYYGTRGNHYVDLNSDGRADAVVVNDDTVTARFSTGGGFGPNVNMTYGPWYGLRLTAFADVTGDGYADAVVANLDTVTVRQTYWGVLSGGVNADWTHGAFYGTIGTYLADIDGDHRADLVKLDQDGVHARRAIATSGNFYALGDAFGPSRLVTTGYAAGGFGTYLADVNGDGKADLIAVNRF